MLSACVTEATLFRVVLLSYVLLPNMNTSSQITWRETKTCLFSLAVKFPHVSACLVLQRLNVLLSLYLYRVVVVGFFLGHYACTFVFRHYTFKCVVRLCKHKPCTVLS